MTNIKWKCLVPVVVGSSFLASPFVLSAELENKTFTSSMSSISSGTHTVSLGNVTFDASGYTGNANYQRALFNTLNGAVNINISDGNTLTLRGFNNHATDERATLHAYKRGTLSGTMTFTGGNIVVSNEVNNSYADIYGLFAGPGGKFDFKSNGDNKVNLTVLMPQAGYVSTHRSGIGLYNGELAFDGGNFVINVDGDPGDNSIDRRVGMVLAAGSNVDIKADRIDIDANELALHFAARAGDNTNNTAYNVINTAKFDADYITLKGSQGILAGLPYATYGTRNSIEFTGLTQIEALSRGDENNLFGEAGGGRAIDLMATDITFNSNAVIVGENLTYLGNRPGYEHEYLGWIDAYWMRTISLTDQSSLIAKGDFLLTSNGGYYNTGLYLWKSEAQFQGKTAITMQNGVDTARAVYAYDGGSNTTKVEFQDDLGISLSDTHANYVVGIEAAAGGIVDVQKGLLMTDNSDPTWSLLSRGANSLINVNSSETGTVQVVGDIGAINDATLNMVLNNANSYLTATSYTATSGSTSNGIVNLDLSRGAVWNMTGSSHVTDISLDGGIVNYLPPESNGLFKTLTVEGNFYGGGTLKMNTTLGGDDSPTDKLIVEGDTSGNTLVAVNNIGGTGSQTVNGIEIVEVYGDSAGTFAKAGRIVAGAYDYDVVKKGSNWYLTNTFITDPVPEPEPTPDPDPTPAPTPQPEGEKTYRPETGSYLANILAANTLFTTRLHDRLGETQYTDALTGEQKVTSLWMRHIGGHNRFKDGSGQISTQSNRYVMQLGGDIAQWSTDGLDRWHLGLMAGYANSKSRSHSSLTGYTSRGEISGYSAGLYGTWYANDADKTGAYVDAWMLYNWFDNTVSGQGLASEKYDSDGITASVEAGYTFRLGERSNGRDSYWLQPKAQVTWMDVQADTHVEKNGTRVVDKTNGNLQTRLGVKAYIQGHNALDDGKDRTFQPFVEANWIHNTSNYSVRMDDINNEVKGSRNIGELKVGVEGQLSQRLQLWGNVAQQIGDNGYSDTQGMLGLKYSF